MPHEPDLGLGRPASAGAPIAAEVTNWADAKVEPNLKDPKNLCRYNVHACATGGSLLDTIQSMTTRGLAAVRADIEQHDSAHRQSSGS